MPLIDTSAIRKGPTYWFRHGIEKPDGTLWGLGPADSSGNCEFPKLWNDPAYVPRHIRLLYEIGRWNPKADGELRAVRVCLVRVDDLDAPPRAQPAIAPPKEKLIGRKPRSKRRRRPAASARKRRT